MCSLYSGGFVDLIFGGDALVERKRCCCSIVSFGRKLNQRIVDGLNWMVAQNWHSRVIRDWILRSPSPSLGFASRPISIQIGSQTGNDICFKHSAFLTSQSNRGPSNRLYHLPLSIHKLFHSIVAIGVSQRCLA